MPCDVDQRGDGAAATSLEDVFVSKWWHNVSKIESDGDCMVQMQQQTLLVGAGFDAFEECHGVSCLAVAGLCAPRD